MVIWLLAGNVATMADNLHIGYSMAGRTSGLKLAVLEVTGGDAGGLANRGEVERTYEELIGPSFLLPSRHSI